MFLKIPQNSQVIACTRLSWLLHRVFPEDFSKILGTPFSWNTSELLLLITVLRHFCFRTDQYLFNIPTFSGYIKIHDPRSLVTFSHRVNTIEVKITLVLQKFMIFTIFAKPSAKILNRFWQGSEYTRILNMPAYTEF